MSTKDFSSYKTALTFKGHRFLSVSIETGSGVYNCYLFLYDVHGRQVHLDLFLPPYDPMASLDARAGKDCIEVIGRFPAAPNKPTIVARYYPKG